MNASWQGAGTGANAAMPAVYAVATLIILCAVIAAFILLRRRQKQRRATISPENHRVSVRDVVHVDERRRLVLIRRDNIEHLLLTGGDTDLVVETFPDSSQAERATAAIFAAQENGRLPKPAAGVLPQPERENAYTARPQPVQQQNRVAAPDSRQAEARRLDSRLNEQETAPRPRPAAEVRPAGAGAPAAEAGRESPEAARSADPREADIYRGRNEAGLPPRRQEQNFTAETRGQAEAAGRAAPAGGFLYEDNNFSAEHQAGRQPRPQADNAAAQRGQNDRAPGRFGQNQEAAQQNVYARREREMAAQGQQAAGNKGANGAARNVAPAQPQRQPAGAYAPYLGYMPQVAPHPAQPQQNRDNGRITAQNAPRPGGRPVADARNEAAFAAAEQERIPANDYGYSRERRPDAAAQRPAERKFAPAAPQREGALRREPREAGFDERRNSGAPQGSYGREGQIRPVQNAGEQRYAPQPERTAGNGGERRSAAPIYPVFAEREERQNRNNASAFDLNPQGSRNGFSRVAPADDNDFDKILQDELLRAPNAINFANAAKK